MCDQLIIVTVHYSWSYHTWENLEWEKLANLVNCELFANILLANYFFRKYKIISVTEI